MEYEFEFREGAGTPDLEIVLSGVLDAADFRRFTEALNADRRFRPALKVLADLSGLDTSGLTQDTLRALSEPLIERDWHYPPAAVAIIAVDPRTLEAVRAYRAHLGGSKSKRHIFTTRAEALAWLQEQTA